jgi:hypothetical protein
MGLEPGQLLLKGLFIVPEMLFSPKHALEYLF